MKESEQCQIHLEPRACCLEEPVKKKRKPQSLREKQVRDRRLRSVRLQELIANESQPPVSEQLEERLTQRL